jgi:predicted nucleic acid-binding protein
MADLKQYMIDTNAVRYYVNPDRQYQKPARRFWRKAREEIQNGEAVLLVPGEVVRELNIQSFSFSAHGNQKELNNITQLLEYCNVVPSVSSDEIEHEIRKLSAHIRANYRADIDCGKGVHYPSVSDARILCTAWQEDCVLVTANIKDFMLYPLLDASSESKLYDILSDTYIEITEEAHSKIHKDPQFKTMFERLNELVEELET